MLLTTAAWILAALCSYPLVNVLASRFATSEAAHWREQVAAAAAELAAPAFVGARFEGLDAQLRPLVDLPGIVGVDIYTVDDERLVSVRRPGARPPLSAHAVASRLQPVTSRGTILGFVRVEQDPAPLTRRLHGVLLICWASLNGIVGAILLALAAAQGVLQFRRLQRLRDRVLLLRGGGAGTTPDLTGPLEDMESWLPHQPRPEPAREPDYGISLEVLVETGADLDARARTEITALVASQARKITDVYGGQSRTLPGEGVLIRLPDGRPDSREQAIYAAWVLRALITGSDRHDPRAPIALRLGHAEVPAAALAPGAIALGRTFTPNGLAPERFVLAEPDGATGSAASGFDADTVFLLDLQGEVRRTLVRQYRVLDRLDGDGQTRAD